MFAQAHAVINSCRYTQGSCSLQAEPELPVSISCIVFLTTTIYRIEEVTMLTHFSTISHKLL